MSFKTRVLAAVLVLAATLPLRAQTPSQTSAEAVEEEHPRIERVTFGGVASLPVPELEGAIETKATRCRGTFLLGPICKLTKWSTLIDRRYLDRQEIPRDELRLEVLYFRRGYRHAVVTSEVRPFGDGVEVHFEIDEGPATVISSIEIRQSAEVLDDRTIERALLPQVGEPLDLLKIEAGKSYLQDNLGARAYLDGVVTDSTQISGLDASLIVQITTGRASTLAGVDISGNEKIDDATVAQAVQLRMGRILRTSDIVSAQRSLYESNLFHEARLELPPQPDSAKRIEITVREAPPRARRIGGGFSTAEFVQVEGRFTHYNWMGKGRRLDVNATVGNLFASSLNGHSFFDDVLPPTLSVDDPDAFLRPTWRAGVEIMQPGFLSVYNRVGMGAFAHRRTVPGVVVDEGIGVSVSVTRRLDFKTPLTLEYRFEDNSVQAGDLYFCGNYGICDFGGIDALRGRHRLSPLGLALTSDHADHPLSPKSGYRVRAQVEHASALTLSDFRYNRLEGEAAIYHPMDLMRERILTARVRTGWVGALPGTAGALDLDATELDLLHPRRRFFAGGSRSVRGFGENQLGPRVLTVDPAKLVGDGDGPCTQAQVADGTCDPASLRVEDFTPRPLGGAALLEAGIEYRFPLFGALKGAVFADAAAVSAVSERFLDAVVALTPGFGFRYHSPVAPIRLDIAVRPTLAEDLPVLTEVLGADGRRRLVRLQTLRHYDPVGDAAGGWWGSLMSHLRLHISIGEAW
jgi:outer membrane protein insertion porin family